MLQEMSRKVQTPRPNPSPPGPHPLVHEVAGVLLWERRRPQAWWRVRSGRCLFRFTDQRAGWNRGHTVTAARSQATTTGTPAWVMIDPTASDPTASTAGNADETFVDVYLRRLDVEPRKPNELT
jgi:hypothetical protein